MKFILNIMFVLCVTNCIGQHSVSIDKIILEATRPTWLTLSGPAYAKYILIEIWEEKKWQIYSTRKKHKKYQKTIYRQSGWCNLSHGIGVGTSVDPGKYVLRVVFDYNNKKISQEHVRVIDTRIES